MPMEDDENNAEHHQPAVRWCRPALAKAETPSSLQLQAAVVCSVTGSQKK